MQVSSLARQNANEGLDKMVQDSVAKIEIEIPLVRADSARAAVFPFLVCTAPPSVDSENFLTDTDIAVHLPDRAQTNANGGLKKLLQDVTATYRDEWRRCIVQFLNQDDKIDRCGVISYSTDFMSGIQEVRKDIEKREGFEDDRHWKQCAEHEIGIMLKHMVWFKLDEEKQAHLRLERAMRGLTLVE